MNLRCLLGFHAWFYYDEFGTFDCDRRICRRCGKIESTYLNPAMFSIDVYEPCGFASKEQKSQILDPKYQIKKYQAALDELIEKNKERQQFEKLYPNTTPELTRSSSELNFLERKIMADYNQKITELSIVTHAKRTEETQ
ncbi:MAG TPA: hypothetical protein VMW50_03310 [Dehalococcoidia bacterium]|nr:hypothetical protein [Dehalococcoidia bacterium]